MCSLPCGGCSRKSLPPAVIEMSALVDRAQFAGHSLIYLPKYVDPSDPMFERTDKEIETSFISALQRMYPHFHPADVIAIKISRVRRVLAISTLNYSENLPPTATSVPNLHIINSAHIANGTLNVNETIQLANTAAADLLNQSQSIRTTKARRHEENKPQISQIAQI